MSSVQFGVCLSRLDIMSRISDVLDPADQFQFQTINVYTVQYDQ